MRDAAARRLVDFNTLLKAANLGVAALLVYAYLNEFKNEYSDANTILLGLALCLQTHIALMVEMRRRDPFVILLAFNMVFYYGLRVFTLSLHPFSAVFDRYPYDVADTNFALLYIIVANLLLYAGLFAVRIPAGQRISADGWRATSPGSAAALMSVIIVLAYVSGNFWTQGDLPRALSVIIVLLSPFIIVLMALTYFLLFRKTLSRKFVFTIGFLIVLELVAHTLWGSRSALVGFIQSFIVVALAVAGSIKMTRTYAVLGTVLAPALLALLVGAFVISTYNRNARETGDVTLDVGRSLAAASESSSNLVNAAPALEILLPPIAARAGYFDFSAEIMAHRERYQPVLNLPTYGKSIIDNILTPGFDLFDQPKIANSLLFIYKSWGTPSKEKVVDFYHSDQLGIYGEFYALFGYAGLLLFFLVPFGLKRLYVGLHSVNPFMLAMKRIVVMMVFIRLLDSFGLDWVIADIVPLVAAVFLYSIFFASRRTVRAGTGPAGAPADAGARALLEGDLRA